MRFKPTVPVFDGHASLGRRRDQRVAMAGAEDLLRVMAESGIDKTLVYHRYAVEYDTRLGNQLLMEELQGKTNLVPQFMVNFSSDNLVNFSDLVNGLRVRSLRACPNSHLYPFVNWVVGDWLAWMAEEELGLWLPSDEVDFRDLYQTVKPYPNLKVVLVGVHYRHYATVWPLVQALSNLYLDLSCFDIPHGVKNLCNRIGYRRLLFGSNFPELAPLPYLYYLHRSELSDVELQGICHDNLVRLLGGESRE